MLALCSPMLAVCGLRSALCWPYVGLSWPYVGPILALCRPIMSTNFPEVSQNTFNMTFFPCRGTPWTPKPRKTRGFLMAPRWNSGTTKGTKHRKTRCFWTPWAEYTVNYKGSGAGEVTPRWARGHPPRGRRQGRHATITFGYQPKASGKDTDRLGSGRRPDLKAYAWQPGAGPMLAPMWTLCRPERSLPLCWP